MQFLGSMTFAHTTFAQRHSKAFSAHLRRFFAQTKPLAFGGKKTNVIILKSENKWRLFFAHFL
jgi:hypothetical protein